MSRLLRPFGKGKSRFIHPDEARRRLDEIVVDEPAPQPPNPPATTGEFSIESLADRYRICGVMLDNEEYSVDMSKTLLDGGNSHTQDQWVTLTQKLPSAKLYTALILTLYANKDHKDAQQKALVEEVKGVLKQDFEKYYMMTSTRVAYQPQGKDKVTHDYGSTKPQVIDEEIVGPHAWVNQASGLEKPVNAILGTSKLREIEQAYEWLSGQKPRLWRLNSKPQQEVLRAVVFGVDSSGRFNISADSFSCNRPARGCDLVAREKTP